MSVYSAKCTVKLVLAILEDIRSQIECLYRKILFIYTYKNIKSPGLGAQGKTGIKNNDG